MMMVIALTMTSVIIIMIMLRREIPRGRGKEGGVGGLAALIPAGLRIAGSLLPLCSIKTQSLQRS